jgi:hypothetical protein
MSTALAEIINWFTEDVVCPLPDATPEIQTRLQRLPQSPWRSLGGLLDYTDWPERDRFVRLDMEIRARQIQQARIEAHSRQFRAA